jgi:preprotein translocase subunit SecB
MSENKDPGISIDLIRLIAANVEVKNLKGKAEYSLRLVNFERKESAEGKFLDVIAGFDMMCGVEAPVFTFTCTFIARYSRQGESAMEWKSFSSPLALAHIFPYLREFVSNITNRLPVPVLLLPAYNTSSLLADFEASQAEKVLVETPKPV